MLPFICTDVGGAILLLLLLVLLLLLLLLLLLQLSTGSTSKIFQHYVLKQRIGSGSWGEVFVAIERLSGIQRAVKRIPKR